MLKHLPMPRDSRQAESIIDSFSQLSEDGRAWFSSEAKLAKAHIASDGKRIVYLFALLTLAVGAVCSGMVLILLWAVTVLAPQVGGVANASGLLGLLIFFIAALAAWTMLHIIREQLGISAVLNRWVSILRYGPGKMS